MPGPQGVEQVSCTAGMLVKQKSVELPESKIEELVRQDHKKAKWDKVLPLPCYE